MVTPTERKIKDRTRKGIGTDHIRLDPRHPPNPRNPEKVQERERKEKDPQHHLQKERMLHAHFSFVTSAVKEMIKNSNTKAKSTKSTKRKRRIKGKRIFSRVGPVPSGRSCLQRTIIQG